MPAPIAHLRYADPTTSGGAASTVKWVVMSSTAGGRPEVWSVVSLARLDSLW